MKKLIWVGVIFSLLLTPVEVVQGQQGKKRERIAVMVFSQGGVDERLRAMVERDLRNMVVTAESSGRFYGRLYPVELFFDVGQLGKAKLESSKRHFNNAQRAFEAGDYEEAKEQLTRAERFYLKGIPQVYRSNEELLLNIYYLNFLTHRALKKAKETREFYCTYISLARSISGSVGAIDQYDSLAEMCEDSPISGSTELKVSSDLDGAHVYIDNEPVGIVDSRTPYLNPFLPSGVHLVEVRKIGYARWGELVLLKNGKSKSLRARLKEAKNRNIDYKPIASLKVYGEEANSDEFLNNTLYNLTLRFKVDTLILVYLNQGPQEGDIVLDFVSFRDEALGPKVEVRFNSAQRNGYYQALAQGWQELFGFDLKPQEMRATQSRWTPTFFKVE